MENKYTSNKCWYHAVCTQECSSTCIRYNEMKYLVNNSGIPVTRQNIEQLIADEDYNEYLRLAEIKSNIVEFVEAGSNLFITSKNTGNGKTSWLIKLLMKYFDEIWAGNGMRVRGLFAHVPTLLLQLKNFQNPLSEEYKQNLMNADLVAWDEIASSNISNYDYSNLLVLIEYRLFNNKSNLFTGNLETKEALEDILGAKLASRIWNTSEIIIFRGKDKRGINSNFK